MTVQPAWRVRRWASLLITIEAVLLVAAIAVGLVGLNLLSDARARVVDEVDPQMLQAQSLATALLNQETGVRGYLLTGDQTFRAPYDDGRRQQDQAVAELRRLGAVDGTSAGADLATVLSRAQAWQLIAEASTSAPDPALAGVGKTQFDLVRSALDVQYANLTAARESTRADLTFAAGLLAVMLGAVTVLLVLFFVLLPLGFHRRIVRPILTLAGEVRTATDDIEHHIPPGQGPRELTELTADIEALRQRLVTEVALLDQRTQELQRSNSDLEQFAYVASHDLQEPLRKVTSFCQLIQHRYQDKLDERGEQYIEFAVDGARRMQVLINDLLAFSRVGRGATKFVDLDTGDALRAAIGNLEQVIEETGAEITHTDLPVVRGELSLLTAAFQNLLGNAIKFRGESPARISVSAERTGDEWTFSVTDNGIGIEPEYAERIFMIFQRLHARGEHEGTGIGLALTRKIIEYHGGTVWLDAGTGDGQTTFRFTLPAAKEDDET